MAKLFLQVILFVAVIGVLDCAPVSPTPVPPGPLHVPEPSRDGKDAGTPPKSRPARQAPQPQNNQSPPRPLLSAPRQNTNPTTTPKTRVARADDPKPAPQPNAPRANLDGHSTTPKSRQAREADHEGKPHDDASHPPLAGLHTKVDNQGHGTSPKPRPARAADHDGKPHDDHDGHSTTPKSRPARAAEEQPKTNAKQPAQPLPLSVAKHENPALNANPHARPARATDTPDTLPPAPHPGQTKEARDKTQEEKSEQRHRRDTEEPQDIFNKPHIILKGQPVPINFNDKQEETARHQSADKTHRARRDAPKAQEEKQQPLSKPKVQPLPATHDRHQRDTAQPTPSTNPANPKQFASSHGPTQGDLENIRRAKEEREKQAQH